MDAEDTQHDPLRDAREAALRRIGEMRQRNLGTSESAGPDLRTLLARSERHVDELRRSASELAAILPTRVEAAVARALGEDEGGLGRRLDSVLDQSGQLAAAVERVERDLLAERMARVEDLEVLVDLVSGGLSALRADLRSVRRELAELQAVVGQPLQVTVAREHAADAAAARGATGIPARAREHRGRGRTPRARTPTRPDTPSSHPRVDLSPPAPRSWRHAGTSTGKRRDHRAHGGSHGARGHARPGRRAARATARRSVGDAISGAFAGGTPTAPGLDTFERLLLGQRDERGSGWRDVARSPHALRARLGQSGDAAFAATLRPLVARALSEAAIAGAPGVSGSSIARAEDAWLRERFHPGALSRFKEFAVSASGKAGGISSLFRDAGLRSDEEDGIEPGRAAGDVVVEVDDGLREVVLRRRPDAGLTVVAQQARLSITGGTQP